MREVERRGRPKYVPSTSPDNIPSADKINISKWIFQFISSGGNFKILALFEYFMSNALFPPTCKSLLVISAKPVIMIYLM